jgi:hypothetical protein
MEVRDIRIQLEIDTGAGTMCPVTDDYYITADTEMLYVAAGVDLHALHDEPACQLGLAIVDALPKFFERDPQRPQLVELLRDCLTHPAALLAVIEVDPPVELHKTQDRRIAELEARVAELEQALGAKLTLVPEVNKL